MEFTRIVMGGLLICAFGLVSCDQSAPRDREGLQEQNARLHEDLTEAKSPFDQRMAEIMTHADRVEACRISEVKLRGQPGWKEEELGKRSVVEPAIAAKLSDLLRDPRSYRLAFVGCFEPGVLFDFIAKNGHVVVRVCFHCGNLSITATDAAGNEWQGGGTFSPAIRNLAGLAKKIFPDDADIQALYDPEVTVPPK